MVIQDLHLFDRLHEFVENHEGGPMDEVVMVALLSVFGFFLFGMRRLQDQGREIKARQKAEDRARHLALADPLTGLPNRREFVIRLTSALGGPGRSA